LLYASPFLDLSTASKSVVDRLHASDNGQCFHRDMPYENFVIVKFGKLCGKGAIGIVLNDNVEECERGREARAGHPANAARGGGLDLWKS
jgi:hypothetical protein